jgi:hypothetical protein
MAKRQTIKLLVTPPMQRAADLRGIPLTLWMQAMIHKAAWGDIIEARTILEAAGFADHNDRLRRENALRDKYKRNLSPAELEETREMVKRHHRTHHGKKEKKARIKIVPYEDQRYAPPMPDVPTTTGTGVSCLSTGRTTTAACLSACRPRGSMVPTSRRRAQLHALLSATGCTENIPNASRWPCPADVPLTAR